MSYINKTTLNINATTNAGRADLTISNYEWKINSTQINNNTDTLIINTVDLPLGDSTISLRVQNSTPCNKWSEIVTKIINIIEEINMTTQTDPVIINQPTMAVTVTLRRKSDVTITVLDDPNSTTPNAPIAGATVEISGVTGTTDVEGKATLSNVPYTVSGIINTTAP